MENVEDLAARCAVALYSDGRFVGSGFSIAPGQVLTCAHVAYECGRGPITVCWPDGSLAEDDEDRRQVIPPEPGSGPTYASPDLALFFVDTPPGQPFVWLADQTPAAASEMVGFGFSGHTPEGGIAPDSVLLKGAGGRRLIKVQDGQISGGMSGSLVLDIGSQRVCGMVKASRDPGAPRGGWIIPVSVIAEYLRETVEQNMSGHEATSPWRQAATRHAEFARRLFGSGSPLRVPDPPPDAPPSWWLDPRHRITRFQERPELDDLLGWAADVNPGTPVAKLVIGEGGSGKTRLAVELATRLGAQGWIAGLLTADDIPRLPTIAAALPEILAYRHRVFIALDYPEGFGGSLTEFLSQIPGPDQGTVRILLLARFGGRWWSNMHPSGGGIKHLIDHTAIELAPLGADPALAANRFTEAVDDYRLSVTGPATSRSSRAAVPAGLADIARSHVTAIKLHALALVSVLHERDHGVMPSGEAAWTDPLTMLVSHERKHWLKAASVRLSRIYDEPLNGRILLAPTLVPAYRSEDAIAAISRIPGLADQFPDDPPKIAALLRDLYPPGGPASLRWWSPLPLDRLGETLLAEVFADSPDSQSATEYATAVVGAADLAQAVPGLTVMTRLNADSQISSDFAAAIGRCLETLATRDRFRLLPALLLADRQVASGARLGERCLAGLGLADAFALLQGLDQFSGHRLLQETALTLLDHVDSILDTDEMRTAGLSAELRQFGLDMAARGLKLPFGTLAHVHAEAMRAHVLLQLGRAGEAVVLAASAARSMRLLFDASEGPGGPRIVRDKHLIAVVTDPSDQSESLLHILNIHAETLEAVGRLEESADVRRKCAALAGQRAEADDPRSTGIATTHLFKLARIQLELGHADQAEASARAAVEFARVLPVSPLTAEVVTLWAQTLNRAGRAADARAVAAKALALHRQVAQETGNRAQLAVALAALEDLGSPSASQGDPLAVLHQEALIDPAAVTPLLVTTATRRVARLIEQEQTEEARQVMAEAITQARRLAGDDPDTYLDLLAAELMQSAYLGLSVDPIAVLTEAIGIFRRLVDQYDHGDMRIGLALSLQLRSLELRGDGLDEAALRGFAEAVELLRPMLAQDRWRAAVHLSVMLGLFSETARKHGDPVQAVAAAREAIDLEVARTDDITPAPAERITQLQRMLFLALAKLMGTDARQDPELAVRIAVATEICELARAFPAATMDATEIRIFAGARGIIGLTLIDAERPEAALPWLGEAAKVLRDHAGEDAAGDNTSLLLRLGLAHVHAYRTLERYSEAAHAMAEVVTDCRRPLKAEEEKRFDCLLEAVNLIDRLVMPAFAAERLEIAVEISRTCRNLPGNAAQSQESAALVQGFAAASAVLIRGSLNETAGSGPPDDSRQAAVAEISACIHFLAERAPRLLGTEHAEALKFGAGLLAAADDLNQALDLITRAMDLYRSLAGSGGDPPQAAVDCLVLQGLILSRMQRPEDAIPPLEEALPLLLAAGRGISADQLGLLNMTLDVLNQAYLTLGRHSDRQVMIDSLRAARLPPSVRDHSADREPAADLRADLKAAATVAVSDPGRGATPLQEVLGAAVRREDFQVAWAASRYLTTALHKSGRLAEAVHIADLMIAYGRRARIGPWTQLYDESTRLQIRAAAGIDDQAILTAASSLIATAEGLPWESAHAAGVDPEWVRESLLRSAANAAARLHQWPDVLRYVQAEVASLRQRGAPAVEVADAEFNTYSALVKTNRIAEAEAVLDRCEAANRQAPGFQYHHLGLITQARADLAAVTGEPDRAVELQSRALGWLYQSGEIPQIQQAHSSFSQWLAAADPFSARALAHELAAAVLAVLLGMTADIPTLTRGMIRRAGDYPATLPRLCAIIEETPGVRLQELLQRLSLNVTSSPSEIFGGLLRQAYDTQRAGLDEFARHRMEWDPVFAGMIAARNGSIAAARVVSRRLRIYAADASWSHFAEALGQILRQRPDAIADIPLDFIDQSFLRRCQDALDGEVDIDPELVHAIPIAGELSRFLGRAQANQPSSALARMLELLAEQDPWRELADPLRRILAGDRDSGLSAGLAPGNAAIISALLGHLATP
jgi:tetratricopeptide (TPR) repeat protein